MISITAMPKATLAELVLFLAEHETFASVEQLAGAFTVTEVRAALRELGVSLAREAADEGDAASTEEELSSRAREILAGLPQQESRRLLAAFGLTPNPSTASR